MSQHLRPQALGLYALIGIAVLLAWYIATGPTHAVPASDAPGAHDEAVVTGGGATFPAALYQAWFFDYNRTAAPGVKVNYQPIGSGGGIQQFTDGTMLFGATDTPMTAAELARAPDTVHLPTALGAVVIAYNVPGVRTTLTLDGAVLAGIYFHTITAWSDPAIAALNPGVELPNQPIQVLHRSDGSGTSFVFTEYLSAVSERWAQSVGTSKNPNWPAGQGAQGVSGLAALLKQTPNSIAYIDLNYAVANRITYAAVMNPNGEAVVPTLDSVSAAAAAVTVPDDFRVSLANAAGHNAYPISSFTYLLLHRQTDSCSRERPFVNLLWWALHDPEAQATAVSLNFAPLPATLRERVDGALRSLRCGGTTVLPAS